MYCMKQFIFHNIDVSFYVSHYKLYGDGAFAVGIVL